MSDLGIPRVGDWVEVRSLDEIRMTLDRDGELEHLPVMPEMAEHCGRRARVSAVMTKICSGGMRRVLGEPLVILDGLRCEGGFHARCSRACTLLWKPAWLRVAGPAGGQPGVHPGEGPSVWPYRTHTAGGNQLCQATALPRATRAVSIPGKAWSAISDVRKNEWSIGSLLTVYFHRLSDGLASRARRAVGVIRGKKRTPVEQLGLRPGDWVQVKSLKEISATLDLKNKNRGLEFSRYMLPFCGGTYRVSGRVENFVDERTGKVRQLKNTVILEGVCCGGGTTSGPCRRAEYLYWREIWLRRTAPPSRARP